MIFTVWSLALVISLAQLAWKDEGWKSRIEDRQCIVNQDKYYQIFATLSSFYVPLAVILFLYWKIFQAARKRIRKRRPPPATSLLPRPAAETSLITTASSSNPSPEKTVLINNYGGVKDHLGGATGGESELGGAATSSGGPDSVRRSAMHHQLLPPGSPNSSTAGITPENTPARKIKATRESGESKRERKAAKTLAIITGRSIRPWVHRIYGLEGETVREESTELHTFTSLRCKHNNTFSSLSVFIRRTLDIL
jgi:5-hydroxytryptamine receptor 1